MSSHGNDSLGEIIFSYNINTVLIWWAQSPLICLVFLFCFLLFSHQFCFELESRLESLFRRSSTAERRRSSKSHNQYEAVYSADDSASGTPEQGRPQCWQSNRVRRATFNSEPLRGFYRGGFIKQTAFVFTSGWINKQPTAQLLRYLHPHEDKTTARWKRIMGSGYPS